jgi:hypothetical protein
LHATLIVDTTDKVRKISFAAGADPKSLFSASANWPAGMPWVLGSLTKPEELPNFS